LYLIDTHVHLDSAWFDRDRLEIISRSRRAGVRQIIVPATSFRNFSAVLAFPAQYEGIYAAVGIYPRYGKDWSPTDIDRVRDAARTPGVVAIGEVGLDYSFNNRTSKEIQQKMLVAHLELAAELHLPVILHNKLSYDDTLALFAASPLAHIDNAGVLHGFSADFETACRAIDLGLFLSFYGPSTYFTGKYQKLVSQLPLDRLLVETDAPCAAPFPYRGRRSEPAHVRLVAGALARYKGLSLEEFAQITTFNARRLFNLPEIASDKDSEVCLPGDYLPPRWGKKGLEWEK
jgi:TatD DNase family protein